MMPELDRGYLSVYTPEQALEAIRKRQYKRTISKPHSDLVGFHLERDGSVWWLTAADAAEAISKSRKIPVLAVETHKFVDGQWITGTESRPTDPKPEGEQHTHVLDGGLPLCKFSTQPPQNWPAGHYWVPLAEDMREVSISGQTACKECFARALEEFAKRWPKPSEVAFTAAGGAIERFTGTGILPADPNPTLGAGYPPPAKCLSCGGGKLSWSVQNQWYSCSQCGWNDQCPPSQLPVPTAPPSQWRACGNCNGGKCYPSLAGGWQCAHCGARFT